MIWSAKQKLISCHVFILIQEYVSPIVLSLLLLSIPLMLYSEARKQQSFLLLAETVSTGLEVQKLYGNLIHSYFDHFIISSVIFQAESMNIFWFQLLRCNYFQFFSEIKIRIILLYTTSVNYIKQIHSVNTHRPNTVEFNF